MSRVDPQVASGYHRMHGPTTLKMLGDDAEVAEMVTWHEIAHAGLNATTTYGLLLQRVGWDSHLDPTPANRERLAALVGAARRTHEVYATSLGAWAVAVDVDRDRLLADYPGYWGFSDDAKGLYAGFREGSLASYAIVEGVALAAMNVSLGDDLQAEEVGATFSVDQLGPEGTPDARFAKLVAAGPPRIEMLDEAPTWQRRLRDLDEPLDATQRLLRTGVEAVFGWAAEVLADQGQPTVAYDGHLSAAQKAELEATGFAQRFAKYLGDQRVVVREGREPLLVDVLDGAPDGLPERPAFVVVLRQTEHLLEDYEVDAAGRAAILEASDHGLSAGLRWRQPSASGQNLRLGLLDSPDALGRLARDLAAVGQPVVSSAALTSTSGASDLAARWHPALLRFTYTTFLLDLDPIQASDLMSELGPHSPGAWADCLSCIQLGRRQEGLSIAYLRFLPARERPLGRPGWPTYGEMAFVALGSDVAARAVHAHWCSDDSFGAEDRPFADWPPFHELLVRLSQDEPRAGFARSHPTSAIRLDP